MLDIAPDETMRRSSTTEVRIRTGKGFAALPRPVAGAFKAINMRRAITLPLAAVTVTQKSALDSAILRVVVVLEITSPVWTSRIPASDF
jgi:hypothetical protein